MRDFQIPGRSAVYASNGMCATSSPVAVKVAVQMLEAGGNAVDAAIAAAVLLGICEPQMTGIGGDCFVLIQPPGGEDIVGLNGSGRAPAGLDAEALRAEHETMPVTGPHAVTVPGAIDAFARLSKDWGKLGLAAALAPAIHYAEAGTPIGPRVAFDWGVSADLLQGVAREQYLIGGQPLRTGQLFRSPGNAEVLRRVAAKGRAGFYEGEVAEDMVAALRALGGTHTLDDFAATECDYVTPISGRYKDVELVELPPNGQGACAILLANILSQFDLASMDPVGSARAHLEAEAAKLAYDARNRFIADPTRVEVKLDHMLSMETAKKLAALIDPGKAMASATKLAGSAHKDTVYLTVVDKDRMMVSLIYSIFRNFGSGLSTDKFGILFQNRGAGFTLEAGHPNEAGGGKRPMHTIIPAMIRRNGATETAFGVMGGQYQSAGHARFLTNLVDYGMDLQGAMVAPRSFPQDGKLQVERGYAPKVHAELRALGHDVVEPVMAIGGSQAIRIMEDGVLEGASDPRKDGCALGY
jgi:gamma-glutamyltranspeptidase/glutathione hydrolase